MKKLLIILFVFVCILVVFAGFVLMWKGSVFFGRQNSFVRGEWYVVRLTSGNIYFGKIAFVHDGILKLEDARYLEMFETKQNKPQEGVSTSQNFSIQPIKELPPQKVFNLIPQGSDELTPTDHTVFFNTNFVSSWEKINRDAEVIQWLEKNESK